MPERAGTALLRWLRVNDRRPRPPWPRRGTSTEDKTASLEKKLNAVVDELSHVEDELSRERKLRRMRETQSAASEARAGAAKQELQRLRERYRHRESDQKMAPMEVAAAAWQ